MKEDEKVEITVRPIKRIVIFQCMEFSIEEFFKRIELMVTCGEQVALSWAEGIVFLALPYHPDCDGIIE